MKIELKSIKIYEAMSEETTCFSAQIYIDGRNAGTASNDGRGGSSDYHSYPGFHETFRKAELFFAEQSDIVYPKDEYMGEFSVKCTFENWIDFQISNFLKEKANKKLMRDCDKHICYKMGMGYGKISWVNYTLQQLLNSPVGIALIQKKVDELKAKGEIILNTNLVGIQL